ncbi:MAG: hypothetical protein ACYTAN_13685, partial [Planctomycetota bacterium]
NTFELSLETPTSLAGDVSLELPSADGAAYAPIITSGAGVLSFGARMALTQSGDVNVLAISKTGSGAGNTLDVHNDGTGYGINLDQDGAAIALNIAQAAGYLAINAIQATNGPCVNFEKTAAGAGTVLELDNDGTGTALVIAQDGDGDAITVAQDGDGSSLVITVDSGNTSGEGIRVNQAANLVGATVSKTGTGAGNALKVYNAGTGYGIDLENVGNGVAMRVQHGVNAQNAVEIYKTGGNAFALYVDQDTDSIAVRVDQGGAARGMQISNSGLTQANELLYLDQTRAGHSGDVFGIYNAGSGYYIHTDAGGGAPYAHLSNAGAWTNGSCLREYKTDFEPVNCDAILESVRNWELMKFRQKRNYDSTSKKRFHAFQDDLISIGIETEGIDTGEMATVGYACIQALIRRVEKLEATTA